MGFNRIQAWPYQARAGAGIRFGSFFVGDLHVTHLLQVSGSRHKTLDDCSTFSSFIALAPGRPGLLVLNLAMHYTRTFWSFRSFLRSSIRKRFRAVQHCGPATYGCPPVPILSVISKRALNGGIGP
jgi:hypothetical protein